MIVLDSSFLIGFHNDRDSHHGSARALMERFLSMEWGRGLLIEYVYLEVVTVINARRGPGIAAEAGSLLLDAAELDFVPCSSFFARTVALFAGQKNTRLSFADAAIALVAQERADGRVLTFDAELLRFPGIQDPKGGKR